jgi:serine/threonine-protein kinase HipA
MEKLKCLYCYKKLQPDEVDFHPACSKKMFGKTIPPELPYTEDQMFELAEKVIRSQSVVTGAQPKLSLELSTRAEKNVPQRFTIVGLWGNYILKPPSVRFPSLPEIEDVTMHLADGTGIAAVPHSLIRLKSGNLAYITKRIDRIKKEKQPMEDMCQLTERLTEHKYHGSHEQIAKIIQRFSTYPGFDVVNFYEQVLFSFLTGNADMHLKNFSMIHKASEGYVLAPAYDLVATKLVMTGDEEELALTLNGKKRNLKEKDFNEAMKRAGMNDKAIENLFTKFQRAIPFWNDVLQQSFLSNDLQQKYLQLIEERAKQIHIGQ